MVAPEQVDHFWVPDFQGEEVRDDLWLVLATVDVVAKEKELLVGFAEFLFVKEGEHVVKLSVYVTNNQHFAINPQQIRLLPQ